MRRNPVIAVFAAASLVMMLIPAPTAHAINREIHYYVYYACVCSPCGPSLEGQWTRHCDGSYSGWGWQPGHNCSTTELSTATFAIPRRLETAESVSHHPSREGLGGTNSVTRLRCASSLTSYSTRLPSVLMC